VCSSRFLTKQTPPNEQYPPQLQPTANFGKEVAAEPPHGSHSEDSGAGAAAHMASSAAQASKAAVVPGTRAAATAAVAPVARGGRDAADGGEARCGRGGGRGARRSGKRGARGGCGSDDTASREAPAAAPAAQPRARRAIAGAGLQQLLSIERGRGAATRSEAPRDEMLGRQQKASQDAEVLPLRSQHADE
jgi:hypothetical protein